MKHGKAPEEKVDDALPLVMALVFASVTASDPNEAAGEAAGAVEAVREQQAQVLDSLPEPERLRMTVAIAQVEEFLKDIKTPEQIFEAFGLPDAGEGE